MKQIFYIRKYLLLENYFFEINILLEFDEKICVKIILIPITIPNSAVNIKSLNMDEISNIKVGMVRFNMYVID